MILLFILFLALLAEAIGRELDRGEDLGRRAQPEVCPGCGGATETDWLLCPRCRKLLRYHCDGCGQSKASSHHFCPQCGCSGERGGGAG